MKLGNVHWGRERIEGERTGGERGLGRERNGGGRGMGEGEKLGREMIVWIGGGRIGEERGLREGDEYWRGDRGSENIWGERIGREMIGGGREIGEGEDLRRERIRDGDD